MANIHPFRGLRPVPELVARVACPPYDVLGDDRARAMAADEPRSFVRVIRAEVDLPPGTDPHSNEAYERASSNLTDMERDGVFVRDETACLYLYRLTLDGRSQHGLVAGYGLDEYKAGKIKKHELTRPDKENDRARHIEHLGANTGPVLLAYRAREDLTRLIAEICSGSEPIYDFESDGVTHTLWVISAPGTQEQLIEAFSAVEALYIADGHHRAASALRVRKRMRDRNPQHTGTEAYNQFLAVAFPADELTVLGYHRVVRDLGTLQPRAFLAQVEERFEVAPASEPAPDGSGRFGMRFDGRWYTLTARPGSYPSDDPVRALDASILQENLLGPVLGIEDPRTDPRIGFVGGTDAAAELERRCEADMQVGFLLHPLRLEQLFAVADAGAIMPPKSTWFEPKLRSGLVIRTIDRSVT